MRQSLPGFHAQHHSHSDAVQPTHARFSCTPDLSAIPPNYGRSFGHFCSGDFAVRSEIGNASRIVHGGTNAVTPGAFQNPTCHKVGPVSAPTGTNPSTMPICWTDAQGVLNTSGPLQAVGTTPISVIGPVLLKNQGATLPLKSSDVSGGVLVTRRGASHTIADPTNEAYPTGS